MSEVAKSYTDSETKRYSSRHFQIEDFFVES